MAEDNRPLVVYVEDDADTFKIASLRLQPKYRLLWAQNDREAVDLIAHHHAQLYAILMDVELKGSLLDGLDLVRLLRGRALSRPTPPFAQRLPVLADLPIIVLTAYTARHSEADAKAVGATHFATKPIDFTRLNLALAQANIAAVMKRFSRPAAPSPAAPASPALPAASPPPR